MKKIFAYFIGIGGAILLFAQKTLASAADATVPLYGSPVQIQGLYGVGYTDIQLAYGAPSFFSVWANIMSDSDLSSAEKFSAISNLFVTYHVLNFIATILIPVIFIIGLIVVVKKWRKNKKQSDVQKNIQNRRA